MASLDISEVMRAAPVIPVLVTNHVAHARRLAELLVPTGLRVLEVTLRTPAAIDVLRELKRVPGAIVGAGTVVSARQVDDVVSAGADFIVSPGLTETVVKRAACRGVPQLPGVATASDIMRGLDLGLSHVKFFPAEAAGGRAALEALSAPFATCRFCPTGGVDLCKAGEWLAIPSVLCVGGGWFNGTDLEQVKLAAREACRLLPE